MGPVGPRWAPCWPHEPCYQGQYVKYVWKWHTLNHYYHISREPLSPASLAPTHWYHHQHYNVTLHMGSASICPPSRSLLSRNYSEGHLSASTSVPLKALEADRVAIITQRHNCVFMRPGFNGGHPPDRRHKISNEWCATTARMTRQWRPAAWHVWMSAVGDAEMVTKRLIPNAVGIHYSTIRYETILFLSQQPPR